MNNLRLEEFGPQHHVEALQVINQAFGYLRSEGWFAWKHLDGPWGPSRGVVAFDDEGMVGLRVILPWCFRRGAKTIIAVRAVEASTVPRAQGRGVFSILNEEIMRGLELAPTWSFVFSTTNQQSRGGYKKLGWSWLAPVQHIYRIAPPAPLGGRMLEGSHALETFAPVTGDAFMRTAWSTDSLRWRLDPRTGYDYRILAVEKRGDVGGLAFRTLSRKGLRIVLPLISWGRPELRRAVLGRACLREKAPVYLDTCGPGSSPAGRGPGLRRGDSLLATWGPQAGESADWPVGDAGQWVMGFADMERVL